ncbi:MAG: ABC-type transport system substrate-binding protein [Halobacteriales archaeon]|jgi:ABC-type transport system substrate-binding protein
MPDSSNTSRRRFLQATAGAAAAASLAGCQGDGGGTTTEPDTETEPEGDGEDGTPTEGEDKDTATTTESAKPDEQKRTLRLVNSTASTFDPIKATDTASGRVISQVFEALTNYPNGQTNVEMRIAKDFEVADDNVTYTFTLQEGLTFNNGEEVTASDFVYSWERLAASDNSRRKSFILGDLGIKHETKTVTEDGEESEVYKPGSLEVSAPSKYKLKFTLDQPFHASLAMLAYTSFVAVPEGIVGDIKGYTGKMDHGTFATKNPVGSGPFTLDTWNTATEIKLSARSMDEYKTMEGPYVTGIHWRVLEKTNASYTYATLNMNADRASVPSSKYDPKKVNIEGKDARGRDYGTYGPLANNMTVPYFKVPEVSTYYFGFNVDNVEEPIRKAFAYAYNQEEVVEQVYKDRIAEAFFFTPPSIFPGGAEKYQELAKEEYPYGYNKTMLGKAKQVMEEAGYGPDNKAKLTMTTYQSSTMKKIGNLMRDKLQAAYINVQYEQAPFSTLLNRVDKGNIECYSLGWIADYPAPDNFLKLLVPEFSQSPDPQSVSGFDWGAKEGEEGDSWSEAARRAQEAWDTKFSNNPLPTGEDKQARNEAYLTIERANWEDVVMVPTFHGIAHYYRYPWVQGPRYGSMGVSRNTYNNLWIEDRSEYKP